MKKESATSGLAQRHLMASIFESGAAILAMIAEREPLHRIQKAICEECEALLDQVLCSYAVLDEKGEFFERVISSSLSDSYLSAITGEGIGPIAGSAGVAAYRKRQVITSDISKDPIWVVHRDLALGEGLKSSWATPILIGDRVVGVFNVYTKSIRELDQLEMNVMDYCAKLLQNAADKLTKSRADLERAYTSDHHLNLLRSEHQFQNVIENISGVYWVNDVVENKTLYVSPSYEKIWGRRRYKLYEDTSDFIQAVHPDDVNIVRKAYENLTESLDADITYRILKPDGEVRWICARVKVVDEDNGRKLEYGYADDITERLDSVRQNKVLINRNQLILKGMLDGFLLADVNGKIITTNAAYANMVGYEQEEILKKNISELEGVFSEEEIKEKINEIIERGAFQIDTKHRHKNGSLIDLEVSISVMDVEEQPLIAAFIRDISDKKKYQRRLEKQFHALEQYAFINSHQVRAHVATMLGLMNLYLKGYVNGEEKKKVIRHMHDEAVHLDNLIRQLSVLISNDHH